MDPTAKQRIPGRTRNARPGMLCHPSSRKAGDSGYTAATATPWPLFGPTT